MIGWKEEIAKIKGDIHGLHDAIKKYLELTENPDRAPVDDLATVGQLTGIFAADIGQNALVNTLSEFMVYYGFDPMPTSDGFYEKLSSKRKVQ